MKNILLIVQREFFTRVRKTSFWLITLFAPLALFGLMAGSVLLATQDDSTYRVFIDDRADLLPIMPADHSDGLVRFSTGVLEDSSAVQAILVIPANFSVEHPNRFAPMLLSEKSLSARAIAYIERKLSDKIEQERLSLFNIDGESYSKVQVDVSLDIRNPDGTASGDMFAEIASVVGLLIGMLVYLAVFIFGSMILRGVVEEKQNRVIEIMLVTVRPIQLMWGKILGIGSVALLQMAVWGVLVFGLQFVAALLFGLPEPNQTGMGMDAPSPEQMNDMLGDLTASLGQVQWMSVLLGSLFFFFTGYLLYGAVFAGLGAAAGDDDEAQGLMIPVSVPIVIGVLILTAASQSPESSIAFWGALIPFTSPIVMPALLVYGVPWWQFLLSAVVMLLTLFGTAFVSARVYRAGILIYGKSKNLKTWLKLLLNPMS